MSKRIRKLIGLALAATFAAVRAVQADVSPIGLSVNVAGSTTYDSGKKSGAQSSRSYATTQVSKATDQKRMEITLQNRTTAAYADLTVKYYLFARDLMAKDVIVLHAGTTQTSLPGLGSKKLNSEEVVMTYTPQGSKRESSGRRAYTMVPVPAKGQRFAGYGVEVWLGDAKLAEKFDPPELKAKAGSAVSAQQSSQPKRYNKGHKH
jgi:hypothetical protein